MLPAAPVTATRIGEDDWEVAMLSWREGEECIPPNSNTGLVGIVLLEDLFLLDER